VLKALFGLALTPAELDLYRAYTGRDSAPAAAVREAWLVVGRRGGKSMLAAAVAVYLAIIAGVFGRGVKLGPGELGVVMVLASDRRQARVIFRYARGLIDASPMLTKEAIDPTADSRALLADYRARFAPDGASLVLGDVDPANFRNREWRRILLRARIGHRALKNLRDTFASQLLTAGVQLGYVSQQLGHADVAVTARHYARWAGGDVYRPPLVLAPGELPADVLAKLVASHQSPTTWTSEVRESLIDSAAVPPARDADSNDSAEACAELRRGSRVEHETGLEPATSTLATWSSTN
jgi:hypothetical protein